MLYVPHPFTLEYTWLLTTAKTSRAAGYYTLCRVWFVILGVVVAVAAAAAVVAASNHHLYCTTYSLSFFSLSLPFARFQFNFRDRRVQIWCCRCYRLIHAPSNININHPNTHTHTYTRFSWVQVECVCTLLTVTWFFIVWNVKMLRVSDRSQVLQFSHSYTHAKLTLVKLHTHTLTPSSIASRTTRKITSITTFLCHSDRTRRKAEIFGQFFPGSFL